jgi:predicted DNA-binding antitoxin AbrB/MazE fold protein
MRVLRFQAKTIAFGVAPQPHMSMVVRRLWSRILIMGHHERAIYENGVLRPLEPLSMPENRQVDLDLTEEDAGGITAQFVPPDTYSEEADGSVTLEEVRHALSSIAGSLLQGLH